MFIGSHEMRLGVCAEATAEWLDHLRNRHGLLCGLNSELSSGSSVKGWAMGDARFSSASLQRLSLTPVGENFSSWQGEWLFVKIVVSGWLVVEQSGSQRRFDSGSFFIIDPELPFVEYAPEKVQLTVLRIPKSKLATRGVKRLRQPLTVPDFTQADVQATRDIICCIASQFDSPSSNARTLFGEQLIELVSVTLLNTHNPLATRQPVTAVHRAKHFIRHNLSNNRLTIDDIASAVYLSSKHLQRLFREDGLTLMRYLWERRLENACSMLLDPNQQALSIQEIAWHSGFSSPAHFSKVFKKKYGLSASDFKAARFAEQLHNSQK